MSALIDKLFTKSQADAIRQLWEDKSSRLFIEQEIGKEILNSPDVIKELPLAQLMFIASMSPFASSSDECYTIAEIVYYSRNSILGY